MLPDVTKIVPSIRVVRAARANLTALAPGPCCTCLQACAGRQPSRNLVGCCHSGSTARRKGAALRKRKKIRRSAVKKAKNFQRDMWGGLTNIVVDAHAKRSSDKADQTCPILLSLDELRARQHTVHTGLIGWVGNSKPGVLPVTAALPRKKSCPYEEQKPNVTTEIATDSPKVYHRCACHEPMQISDQT